MFFYLSRAVSPITSPPQFHILNKPLDRVSSYKYLGLLFTPKLSWSPHILSIIKRARHLIGLFYRHFYRSCPSSTLLSLYKSLVLPILEYSCIIWNPLPTAGLSSLLKSVQHFALKLISKSWSSSYSTLLSKLNVKSLSSRRHKIKLITIFKIHHNLLFYPDPPISSATPSPYNLRSCLSNNLQPINANLQLHKLSFFLATIKSWNSLLPTAKATLSLSEFKYIKISTKENYEEEYDLSEDEEYFAFQALNLDRF